MRFELLEALESRTGRNMPIEPPDFFNVFAAQYEPMAAEYFRGSGAEARILYESSDGRHLAVASRYPQGVRFRYGGAVEYHEVFYVVRGHGQRRYPDGTSLDMHAGDMIYVHPGVEIDYLYEPGFVDVAFFWWEAKPLPAELTAGIARRGLSDLTG